MNADPDPLAGALERAVALVRRRRHATPPQRPLFVALSGIDASGKGWVGARLTAALAADGLRAQLLGVDGWLALPSVRFSATAPAERFYAQGIRFDDLVRQVLAPLRSARSLRVIVDHLAETASTFERREHRLLDLDVLVVEGVFLLRRDLRPWFDVALWIDCSFATALERALRRAQEGLPPAAAAAAYRTIYFPAQELHFLRDAPRAAADLVIDNDPRSGLLMRGCGSDGAGGSVACW